MVGDLQHRHRQRRLSTDQARLDLGADVGGEKERDRSVIDAEHERVVVATAPGRLVGGREWQHAHAAHPDPLGTGELIADRELTAQRGAAARVILIVVGRHEAGQLKHAVIPQEWREHPRAGVEAHATARPGVDDHGPAVGRLDHDRVALADVEHGEPEASVGRTDERPRADRDRNDEMAEREGARPA